MMHSVSLKIFPFSFDREDQVIVCSFFSSFRIANEEVWQILGSMQEYHNKTCIRFRPYEQTDQNWIDIKPDYSGCWSSVGMRKRGQVINFGSPKCLRHGVIIHELMHAIGFFHQQSAAERDDFVEIVWENIRAGREHNFNKYNETVVSSYNETYDYNSVMHYSSKAFSRNGSNTIEPLVRKFCFVSHFFFLFFSATCIFIFAERNRCTAWTKSRAQ